jgi:hypothetical protein
LQTRPVGYTSQMWEALTSPTPVRTSRSTPVVTILEQYSALCGVPVGDMLFYAGDKLLYDGFPGSLLPPVSATDAEAAVSGGSCMTIGVDLLVYDVAGTLGKKLFVCCIHLHNYFLCLP